MPKIAEACGEVSFDPLLRDPVIQAMMRADDVDPATLRALLRRTAAARPEPEPAASDAAELEMSLRSDPDPRYRLGVGIVLYNRSGNVLVGRRADTKHESWQMPQGGIEPGETPRAAALRGLREEIGIDNVEILAESRAWLRYDLPPSLARRVRHGNWRGQQQKWFAMRFCGDDAEIDIATEHSEFVAWQWVPATLVAALIIAFKRRLYREVLAEFGAVGPGGQ